MLPIDTCRRRWRSSRPRRSWRHACARLASATSVGRRSRLASPRFTSARNDDRIAFVSLDTLRSFVDALDEAGELARITKPVSLDRELCEIADRVMKQRGGGRALLFERPTLMNGRPSEFPVC